SRSFTGIVGGPAVAAQTVGLTNSGTGALTGLSVGTIAYGAGGSGWLAASLDVSTAPATLTLKPTPGTLPAGTYTATVPILSTASGVTNSPMNVTISFTLQAPTGPVIRPAVSSMTFASTVGVGSPPA